VQYLEHRQDGVALFHDCVTVGLLTAGHRVLVVEPGSGAVAEAAAAAGCTALDWVLATHYHRDSCWGLDACRARGAAVAVPAAERRLFEDVERYWAAGGTQFHRYWFRPGTNVLAHSVPVDRALSEGDELHWEGYVIRTVATPGHTDGSLSYVVDAGATRYAFVGDLVYDEGRFWELWSLQGPPVRDPVGVEDYHAFCGRAGQAADSLERLLDRFAPTLLVPAHGPLVTRPHEALARLRGHISALMDNYFSISALRHYFGDWVARQSGQASGDPLATLVEAPPWFRLIADTTTRAIVAPSGHALVFDCGMPGAAAGVLRWLAEGLVTAVDAVWVSHYHDDHVGALGELIARTGCAVWAGANIRDILEHPAAYCMPCLDPQPVRVDRVLRDGEQVHWEGFRLTAYDFPGQTLLHSALLVDRDGVRLLVGGDSFTPTGIDDYCSHNRNLLGDGRGYLRCLDLLERLQPDMVVNMHVPRPFAFSTAALARMRTALRERERLLSTFLPWDHPNFGLDPYWARCHPYQHSVSAGRGSALTLQVTNHGASPLAVEAALIVPAGWPAGATVHGEVAPGHEGALTCPFTVPPESASGRYVLSVRLRVDGRDLGAWTEALVDVRED
jgi:glyoxylase-like metal-dependent hydrolase (beta-lactamase superfamily II)